MISESELIKVWFYGLETIGKVARERMLKICGTVEEVFFADKEIFKEVLNAAQYREICEYCDLSLMSERVNKLFERKIKIIHYESEAYPQKLKEIYDPPGILYVKGFINTSLYLNDRNIAIVGSRNADSYGRELSGMFARELAKKGINIISGLALGVDGEAHRGSINAGGYSLGVLGCGINVTYPQAHAELFNQMEQHGGIISEHYLDVKPMPMNFPRRNRIISGLSDGVLVVEAGKNSGSLITADFALEQGKQVYAIPGRVFDNNCEGTNNLIKQGAICVTEVDDIIIDLLGSNKLNETFGENNEKNILKMNKITFTENILAPTEKIVYSCLSLDPVYIDRIVDKSGLSVTDTISCLYGMEKKGVIKQPARGYYIIAL